MEYHEKSIYINAGMLGSEIQNMIEKRLIRNSASSVCVYTRTMKGINKVESEIKSFLDINKNFKVKKGELGEIRKKKSCAYIISKKEN